MTSSVQNPKIVIKTGQTQIDPQISHHTNSVSNNQNITHYPVKNILSKIILNKTPQQNPHCISFPIFHSLSLSPPKSITMASTATRSLLFSLRPTHTQSLSLSSFRRLLSSTPSITFPPPVSAFARPARPTSFISHSVRVASAASTRFGSIRCRVNRSGPYSPLNNSSGSNFSDRPPSEIAPLFPGCDYEHWLIVMDKPGGEGANKQQMIDCYIQTLAKVLGRYLLLTPTLSFSSYYYFYFILRVLVKVHNTPSVLYYSLRPKIYFPFLFFYGNLCK